MKKTEEEQVMNHLEAIRILLRKKVSSADRVRMFKACVRFEDRLANIVFEGK